MSPSKEPYVVTREQGQAIWFLDTLMVFKATGESTGKALSLIEQVLPPGFAPPLHIHHGEDEAFYILEGALTFVCGEHRWQVDAGSFIFLPKDIAHGFLVEGTEPARLLQFAVPTGLEQFHVEMGQPATSLTLPLPTPPDLAKLQILSAKYGIELVGPPVEHEESQ